MIAPKVIIKKIEAMEDWINENTWCQNIMRSGEKRCALGWLFEFCTDQFTAHYTINWINKYLLEHEEIKGTNKIPKFNDRCTHVCQVKDMLLAVTDRMRAKNTNKEVIAHIDSVINSIRGEKEEIIDVRSYLMEVSGAKALFMYILSESQGHPINAGQTVVVPTDKESIIGVLEKAKKELEV